MVRIPMCSICEGRRPFCIHKSYPLPRDFNLQARISEKLSKEFFGPSYSVFVGHHGYPEINMGPMAGLEEKPAIDNPASWFGKPYKDVIEMRALLIRSRQKESIFSRSRFVLENQELAIASKPADTEMVFKKTPVYNFSLSDSLQPMGPVAPLERMRITENVKVERSVEKVITDDLKANEAAFSLYSKDQSVYKITTILSSGALGMERTKKIVPTRWSITATDDIIAKSLMQKIRTYKTVNDFTVYESEYLGNHFVILFMPGNWEFENFEVWAPGSNWSSHTQSRIIGEYEPFHGRTAYAESQAGGYYAARIAAAEALEGIKRQARVVSFREVSEEYVVPMGVWVVRETARHAFESKKAFSSREEAFKYIRTRLKVPLEHYIKGSRILGQKRLWDF